MGHPYIPNSKEVQAKMLQELGLKGINELFSDIPESIKLKKPLDLPPRLSELEVKHHVQAMMAKNKPFTEQLSFLGGGVWPHYIPSHVKTITRRSEFLTSYTPYQPEASQGMLQALFEYQSMICELVGLDVTNASMYDWATALGEAARMCARVTKKRKFLIPELISSERFSTLQNYSSGAGIEPIKIGYEKKTGQLDLEELRQQLSGGDVAGVYIENPSYLGFLETRVDEISELTHRSDALFVIGVNPISLGLLKAPGDYGADVVVGEGQPLGNPVSFGGPLLGIFACRGEQRLLRQLPGRLIGMTTSLDGKERGYVMTFQTREQHIRRERATSSMCTNEGISAVAAAIYLASIGPRGLREVARLCASNARHAMKKLDSVDGLSAPIFEVPHFNEFTLQSKHLKIKELNSALLEKGIQGGKPVNREFPELGETALLCTTELHSREDIDFLVEALKNILEENR